MPTVDERVVKMKLDGSEFQSGASKVSSSLDSLKEKLKFKDAGKGLDDVEKKTKSLSFDAIASSVSALEKRFSTMGIVGINVINRITDSVINLSHRLTSFVSSGIVQGGITRAMNLENAHFQLQGLLKDEQQVQAVMKNVSDSVDGTAYSLDAAAKVASQLAASGMRAGDQMYSSLRAVAGVAAMTNSSYEDIGQIFTAIAGQGRVMGNDLLQLSARGMNAAATLGQAMGKSEAEIRDMVTKGKISFNDFAKAMDNAFGEHAKKANESFSGALSNIKASLARIGAEFISPLIVQNGPFVQLFNTIRERINDVKSEIGPLSDMFTKTTINIVNSMTESFKKLDVKDYVKSFINVVESLGNVAKGVMSVLKPIKQGFQDVFPPATTQQILNFTIKLKELTQNAKITSEQGEQLRKTVARLVSPLKWLTDALIGAAGGLSNLFGGFKGLFNGLLNVANGIVDVIDNIRKNIDFSGVFESLLNTTGSALGGIGRLFAGFGNVISTFAAAIGGVIGNITQGMANMTEGASTAANGITNIFQNAISTLPDIVHTAIESVGRILNDIFKYIPIDNIIRSVQEVLKTLILTDIHGMFADTKQVAKKSLSFIEQIGNILQNFSDIEVKVKKAIDAATKALNTMVHSVQANIILKIAVAVGVLAVSLKLLADIPLEQLGASLGALAGGMAVMGAFALGMVAALKRMSSGFEGMVQLITITKQLNKMAQSMVVFAFAIKILTESMTSLAQLDWGQVARGVTALAGMGVIVAGMIKVLGKLDKVAQISFELIAFSTAIKIMSNALIATAQLKWDEVARGIAGLAGSFAIIIIAMKQLDKASINMAKNTIVLVLIATAMKKLHDSMAAFKDLDFSTIVKSIASIIAFAGSLKIMNRMMESADIGKAVSTALLLVVFAKTMGDVGDSMKHFNDVDWESVGKSLAGMGGFITELMILSKKVGNDYKRFVAISGALAIASQAINTFSKAAKTMAGLSWEEIGKGFVGVSAGLLVMISAINHMPENAVEESAGFAIMAFSLKALTGTLKDLAAMNLVEIGRSIFTLSASLGAIVAAMNLSKEAAAGAGAMAAAAFAIAMLVGPIKALGNMDIRQIAKSLIALSGSLIIITTATRTMSKDALEIVKLSGSLVAFGAAITVLGIGLSSLVYPIKQIGELGAAGALTGIGGVAALIAGIYGLIYAIKGLPDLGIGDIAKIGLLSLVIAGVALVVKNMSEIDNKSALAGATAIAEIITSTGVALALLAGIPVSAAAKAVASLAVVITGMAAVVAAIGGIAQIPGVMWIINEGKNFLKLLGEAIGGFFGGIVGAIVGGTMEGAAAALPSVGKSMSEFMINAGYFFEAAKGIDESAMNGIKSLASAMLTLTGAGILQAATSWFTGGNKMIEFGEQLAEFAPYLNKYAKAVSGINTKAIEESGKATKALADVANAIPNTGGFASAFTGNNDIDTWGKKLPAFGRALSTYSESVSGIDNQSIKNSAEAAKALAEFAKNIPNTGGLVSAFTGNNDIDTWGKKLPAFGKSMKSFADSVKGLDGGLIKSASVAGKALAEMTGSIPNSGGLVAAFTGDNDIALWGPKLAIFGESMAKYGKAVAKLDFAAIKTSASAAKALVDVANAIPDTGGLVTVFSGDNDMATFGAGLEGFGKALAKYSVAIEGIDPKAISASATAASTLVELQKALPYINSLSSLWNGTQDFTPLSEQLPAFGSALSKYSNSVKGIDNSAITSTATAAMSLVELNKALPAVNGIVQWWSGAPDLSMFGDSLAKLGSGVSKYAASVADIDPKVVSSSATALQGLVQIYNNLPAINGLTQWWTGAPDLSTFGDGLKSLGRGAKLFSDGVSGVTPETLTSASNAVLTISKIYENLPAVNGLTQWWTGAPDLSTFAEGMKSLGKGVSAFGTSVADVNPESMTASASAIQVLASVYSNLPAVDGIVQWWSGGPDLSGFADGLKSLGSGIKGYAAEVSGIDTESLSASVTAIRSLSSVVAGMAGKDFSGINSFKDAIAKAGDLGLKKFNEGLTADANSIKQKLTALADAIGSGTSTAKAKIEAMKAGISGSAAGLSSKLKAELQNMVTTAAASSASMSGALNQLKIVFDAFKGNVSDSLNAAVNAMKTCLNNGVSAVKGYGPKFSSAGKDLGKQLTNGVKSGVGNVNGAFTSKLDSAVKAARAYHNSFHDAGAYAAKGFAAGIRDNIRSAANAAAQMAKAASDAAKKNLDIHSPSRVFRKIGDYVGQGFVLGLNQTEKRVGEAAASVGNSAISGFQTTLGDMKKVLSTDVNIEPSITPVVDMSGITHQSRNISSLLNKSNIGMNKTVNGIASLGNVVSTNEVLSQYQNEMMNSNRDLQKSLGDLRDDLGKYNDQLMNSETSIYVDGKKLASSIAKPMNQELGVRSRRGSLAR